MTFHYYHTDLNAGAIDSIVGYLQQTPVKFSLSLVVSTFFARPLIQWPRSWLIETGVVVPSERARTMR